MFIYPEHSPTIENFIMKHSSRLKWMPLVFCLLGLASVRAGELLTPAAGDEVVGDIETGNVDLATQKLGKNNLAAKGTVAWYHQSALVLLGRAEELLAAGETKAGQRVATAAIQIMKQGARKRDPNSRTGNQAQVYVQIAAAYDHLLGDRASARQYYLLALAEMPDLQEAEDALAAYDAEAARVQQFASRGN